MAKRDDLKEVIEITKKYLDVLRKNNISFEKVYLFGSYVNGDFHEGSDIDLAIVANKWNGCTFETRYQLMKINNVDTRIEPHPFETSEFNKTHPFAYEIMRTGKLI
ncbi:MAG: nucleotidyltransferase domain-containing protein [Cytophagales bacterium]|nr:nucleotidyltransferase domain-containing protein [Cytophagales bacterium]